jgi:hypothetical protein
VFQRPVGAVSVIIFHILPKHPFKLPVVEDDHMVQALPSQRADQTLHVRILPGRPRGDEFRLHAQARDSAHELRPVDAVTVTQEKPRRHLESKGIDQLLPGPESRGGLRDGEVHHLPAFMSEDDEDE